MGALPGIRTPLSPSAFHILLAVANGPLHGYAVMQHLTEAQLKVGPGTIYGALHRMQEAGWVEHAGAEKGGGPLKQRRRYGLTAAGREILQQEARRVVWAADVVRSQALLSDEVEVR